MKALSLYVSLLLALLTVSVSNAADSCAEKAEALRRDFYICAQAYSADFCFDFVVIDQQPEPSCAAYKMMCAETCEISYSKDLCLEKCR